MRKLWILAGLAALMVAVMAPQRQDAASYDSQAVRLHIMANSNSAQDQAEKLRVRDAIIEQFSAQLGDLDSAQAAWTALQGLQTDLADYAEAVLQTDGYAYGARVTMGVETFPTRNYMGRLWPAGDYRTVRVLLGEARGDNWWCVMYPPLCVAGTKGEVNMNKYYDEVEAMSSEDKAPKAPVRSAIADKLGKGESWDERFAKLAKTYIARLKGEKE